MRAYAVVYSIFQSDGDILESVLVHAYESSYTYRYSVHAQDCTVRVSILCVKYYIMIAHYTVVLCSTAISPSGTSVSVFSPSSSG